MDQTVDTTKQEFHRLVKLYHAPDFVKRGSYEEISPESPLHPAAYADPIRCRFPIHTKAATWTSYAFFLQNRDQYRPRDAELVEERILRNGRLFGISAELENLKKAHVSAQPDLIDAPSEKDFLLTIKTASKTFSYFPARNPKELLKAAEYLSNIENAYNMPFNCRRTMAVNILEKAAQFGTDLGKHRETIEKMAGYGVCTTKAAASLLRSRVYATVKGPGEFSQEAQEMLKLAEILEQNVGSTFKPEVLVKIAELVDDFDEKHGLRFEVKSGRLSPIEDVLFSYTQQKLAGVTKQVVKTITGNVYNIDDLDKIPLQEIREVIGDDIAESLSSDGVHIDKELAMSAIPTFDRGIAALFDAIAASAGVQPMAKTASAAFGWTTQDFLRMNEQNAE